jgi:hypothetical protein
MGQIVSSETANLVAHAQPLGEKPTAIQSSTRHVEDEFVDFRVPCSHGSEEVTRVSGSDVHHEAWQVARRAFFQPIPQ